MDVDKVEKCPSWGDDLDRSQDSDCGWYQCMAMDCLQLYPYSEIHEPPQPPPVRSLSFVYYGVEVLAPSKYPLP